MLVNVPVSLPNLKPATAARDIDAMSVLDGRSVVVLTHIYPAVDVAIIIEKIDPVRQHRKVLSRQAARMSRRQHKRHDLHQPGGFALV